MFSSLFKSIGLSGRSVVLRAPLEGNVIPLSEVNDETFAAGYLGEGVAVEPTGNRVIAPTTAKIQAIFPTGHAVAFHTVDGLDVLIHLGLETCNLEGRHFRVFAEPGDTVSAGETLIEFDRQAIIHEGYDITVPVLIRNAAEFASIKGDVGNHVTELDQLIVAKGR